MKTISRTKAAFKNLIIGVAGQIFNQLLGFVSRTVFIQQLGMVYLGINGLFTNIFTLLSLAELGIGSAIVYSLYKPLADRDENKIEALMNLYAKAYYIIGSFIFVVGVALIPFLNFIIKGNPEIPHLRLIYILFLLNTVISYFFAYKRTIFNADQKNYVNVINTNVFTLISKIFQITALILTQSFVLYLVIQLICTFLSNLDISIRANKSYPYLRHKTGAKLSSEDFKSIKENVFAMFLLKIGAVIVSGTDNLLISSFIGITWVGIYSNYIMLISIVQTFITQIFTSITASVGNLVNSESKEKAMDIFYKIFFMNFLLYGFSSICLFILLNPFIKLWIGEQFILPTEVVFLIVLNVYLMGIRNVLWIYNNTLGLFYHFRFMPFIEGAINLGVSIILLKKFGISGVVLGTLVSTIVTYIVSEPYVLFKKYFKYPVKRYFSKYFSYLFIMLMVGYLIGFVTSFINEENWIGFLFLTFTTVSMICIFFVLIFYRTNEMKYFYRLVKNFIEKKKNSMQN